MSLIRFILISILAYLALRFVRRLARTLTAPTTSDSGLNAGESRKRTPPVGQSRPTVKCAACGVYVAQNTALSIGGGEFCSKTCAESQTLKS